MEFEFDPQKSAANKQKHGIDFESAKKLWQQPVVEIDAKVVGREKRYAALGVIDSQNYTIVLTYRGSVRRLISARPSTENETALYAQEIESRRKR